MTDDAKTYLDILTELENVATPGDWLWDSYQGVWVGSGGASSRVVECKQPHPRDNADARLVAFHRNIAPEVRAVVEAAREHQEECAPRRVAGIEAHPCKQCDALDALDAKARELAGGGG